MAPELKSDTPASQCFPLLILCHPPQLFLTPLPLIYITVSILTLVSFFQPSLSILHVLPHLSHFIPSVSLLSAYILFPSPHPVFFPCTCIFPSFSPPYPISLSPLSLILLYTPFFFFRSRLLLPLTHLSSPPSRVSFD